MMDHAEAVRQKATERYLMNELDPKARDQFEEHLFDCQDCALDLRTTAMFIEQSKVVLSEAAAASPVRVVVPEPARPAWFAWLRPAFAVPVLAVLLAVVGYQNFVQVPHLEEAASQPQVLPYASIRVDNRALAEAEKLTLGTGQGFNLLVSIPPQSASTPADKLYSVYALELRSPGGDLRWSTKIPAASPDDLRSLYIPAAGLAQGTYKLTVIGITTTGQSSSLGTYPVELQIQK